MPAYTIRRATVSDADVIAHHRVAMFAEMGTLTNDTAGVVKAATVHRLTVNLESGAYVGWLTEADNAVVAGAGVLLHSYYPSSTDPDGRPTAYVLNVYTEPPHRHRHLASTLMREIIAWCHAQDVHRVSLHASSFGRG